MIALSLRRALFGVGPIAACRAILRRAWHQGSTRIPGPPPTSDPFDLACGIETAGFRGWRELRSGRGSDPYNSGYLPIDPTVGRDLLSRVGAPEKYTFLDFGCGKGRMLVLATEIGFKRVIGVEINRALAEIAKQNATKIRGRFPERVPIEILHDDAVEMRFPREPLVIFLNHPFWGPVMQQVSTNLAVSLTEAPRDAIILYVNPVLSKVFDAEPLLERVCPGTSDAQQERQPGVVARDGEVPDHITWRTRMPRHTFTPRRS